jgi:hypothetical protein
MSPITYIYNAILNSGIFPDRLKFASQVTIQKREN